MNNEVNIVTHDTIMAKAAAKLGIDQPSALDLVSRSNFDSDAAYLDAVVRAELERSDPKYQELRRKYAAEYQQRTEEEERKAQAERYKEIRGNIQLDSVDISNIDAEATEKARRDLAAGRIAASEMGKTIEQYAKVLTERRKDTRAANQHFNDIIRNAVLRG